MAVNAHSGISPTKSDKSSAIKLDPPETVRGIAKRLEDAGFETWCVGGAVRDALLGHPHLDWDVATAATPPEVRKLFKRTVPVGIEFGTVGVFDRTGVALALDWSIGARDFLFSNVTFVEGEGRRIGAAQIG